MPMGEVLSNKCDPIIHQLSNDGSAYLLIRLCNFYSFVSISGFVLFNINSHVGVLARRPWTQLRVLRLGMLVGHFIEQLECFLQTATTGAHT